MMNISSKDEEKISRNKNDQRESFSLDSIDDTSRPAKRSKKSSSNDQICELPNELNSSQTEMNE